MYLKNSSGKASQDPYFLKIHPSTSSCFWEGINHEQQCMHTLTLIFELITLKKGEEQDPTCGIIKCKINEEYGTAVGFIDGCVFLAHH